MAGSAAFLVRSRNLPNFARRLAEVRFEVTAELCLIAKTPSIGARENLSDDKPYKSLSLAERR
jgi:hypothetical protein